MLAALSGFLLIAVIVAAGWSVRRWGVLPPDAQPVLARLAWVLLSPCLLFTGVAAADLTALFSAPLLISAAAAVLCYTLHALIIRGRPPGERIIGALGAGYVNANNMGIPIATYVLGDATLVVPIIIMQLLIVTPIALTLLELAVTGHTSVRATLTAPLRNPLIVATLSGAVVSAIGLPIPRVVLDPLVTIGQAAVPVVLLAFGMSLSGRRVLAPGPDRAATIAAVLLKILVMPPAAYLLAVLFRRPPTEAYAVTVLAGLPSAQNVYLYAERFRTGLILARDTVFLTTLACAPVLLSVALLFTFR